MVAVLRRAAEAPPLLAPPLVCYSLTVRTPLGSIVGGSLSHGLTARLDADAAHEAVRAGSFVVVEDGSDTYFSLVSDLELGARDPALLDLPATPGSFTEQVLRGEGLFTAATLKPSLVMRGTDEQKEPVRTIPRHFARVASADEADYGRVFGDPAQAGNFVVGKPLGSEVDIPLDLARFVERSNGIFGRSGTGKSYLTRLLLAGTIQAGACVNLVFDMHNEYGWSADDKRTKGLRQLFPGRVHVYTLDPESSRRRGAKIDGTLTLDWTDIGEQDLELLAPELGLAESALDNVPLLERHYGAGWLKSFIDEPQSAAELAEAINANPSSLSSFARKLQHLGKLPFLGTHSTTQQLIDSLLAGHSVVLEFGQHENILTYALVANVLTRLLHGVYKDRCEAATSDADRPTPLMITIEEAHKFLQPSVSRLTTFGTIARELRKYNTTLLIVDQRPSAIDREVLSQIGTRLLALITDEADVDAALAGMPDPQRLRGILASLDTQQQALLLGHALPMPIVVRTRSYDAAFYASLGGAPLARRTAKQPDARAGGPRADTKAAKVQKDAARASDGDQAAIDLLFGRR